MRPRIGPPSRTNVVTGILRSPVCSNRCVRTELVRTIRATYVRRYVRTRAGVQGGPPFCIALHGGEGHTTRPLTYGEDLPPQLPPLLGPPLPTSHHGGGPHPHGPPRVTCPRTYVAKSGGNGHGSDYVRTFVRARTPLTTYVRTDYAWPIASGVFSADAARKCGGTYVYVREYVRACVCDLVDHLWASPPTCVRAHVRTTVS